MGAVSEAFLLGLAEVLATLIGFLLVAMFFYIDRRQHELAAAWERGVPYLRSTVRMILLLYAVALAVSLGLVVLDRFWVTVLFGLSTLAIVGGGIDVSRRRHSLDQVAHIPGTSRRLMWVAIAVMTLPPWVAGGLEPGRPELTLAALLIGAFAFLNTVGLLMSAFDLDRMLGAAPSRSTKATRGPEA